MIFEPSNEMETVVLFCLLAEKFECQLLNIRSGFPDALISYRGEEIPIEFEFISSNYLQHCHPMDFSGICICWRCDVKLDGIETISPEEIIRNTENQGDGEQISLCLNRA